VILGFVCFKALKGERLKPAVHKRIPAPSYSPPLPQNTVAHSAALKGLSQLVQTIQEASIIRFDRDCIWCPDHAFIFADEICRQ
jgi:hypothetical protein